MEYKFEMQEGRLKVCVPRELDHHLATQLKEEADLLIDAYHVKKLVFDFSNTEFMDSSGIAVVLRVKKRMDETDGDVFLLNPAPQCARVFRTSGIDRFVAIKFTEEKAAR